MFLIDFIFKNMFDYAFILRLIYTFCIFFFKFLSYNLHIIKCTYSKCTIFLVLMNAYSCVTNTPVEIQKISITH